MKELITVIVLLPFAVVFGVLALAAAAIVAVMLAVYWIFGFPIKIPNNGNRIGTLRWFTYTRH